MTETPHKNNATTLFRKILLSFFSKKSMAQAGLNPAAIFISFISAKQFFWLINRRVIEHYKLNMFDITIDPFEVKIWFWEQPTINIKELDFYYGYNSTANFVWYRFYSPNNIATWLSMLLAVLSEPTIWSAYPTYFKHFIFTTYIFVFVIIARIKCIPSGDLQTRYDRCMRTFWSLYTLVFEKTKTKLNPDTLLEVQTEISKDVRLCFILFRIAEHINHYFVPSVWDEKAYYKRLFMDELHDKQRDGYIDYFLHHQQDTIYESSFSVNEKHIIELLIPADISIRYLFGDKEWSAITRYVLHDIYDHHYIGELSHQLIKSDVKTQELLDYITNPNLLKKKFFFGIQHYITNVLLNQQDIIQEIQEWISSSLMNDDDTIDTESNMPPETIKIESNILDRLINFYIWYVGWLQIARWDTWYIRLHKSHLIQEISDQIVKYRDSSPATLNYYTKIILLYSKNLFYYKYAHDHIRAGKDTFHLPIKWTINLQESNNFIMKMLYENAIINILQDINNDNIRLSIKQGESIDIFKEILWEKIAKFIKLKGSEFIHAVYYQYNTIILWKWTDTFSDIVSRHCTDDDIIRMKDRLYNLDFRLAKDTIDYINQSMTLHRIYDATVIFSLLSVLRETLFGLLLFIFYIKSLEEVHQKDYHSTILFYLYCRDILGIDDSLVASYTEWMDSLLHYYNNLFHLWINLDDNQWYLSIWSNNWINRSQNNIDTIIHEELAREDSIRRMWYLKNITYYNKRYLIPEL